MSAKQLYLTPDHIMAVTKEPGIYSRFQFLEPMRESALNVHAQLTKHSCKGCIATARRKATALIAGALVALIDRESRKQPNSLDEFRLELCKVLQLDADKLVLSWSKDGKSGLIQF